MPEGHIFLSYPSIEADFALKLAADLKNAGVNLWVDRLDGIRGGDNWGRSIQLALNTCIGFIPILSPNYIDSGWCMDELARARRLGKPIFPVLLRKLHDMNLDWPIHIESIQYVDFQEYDEGRFYQARLIELLKVLPEAPKGIAPDIETQYLTSLIAELESRRGVLEYVELTAQSDAPRTIKATRPEPRRDEEWAAGFSLLIEKKQAPSRRKLAESLQNSPNEKTFFSTIAEAVEKFPRFVLIGEPGAGKTTTIRRLALEAARRRLENPRTAPLPLLLYLPQWQKETSILDFVRQHWPFSISPVGLLAQGDVLLYLDGLNEMGAVGVEKAKNLLLWFETKDAPKQVIVTCRAGDYSGDMKLGETPTVLAHEMDRRQIEIFTKEYLKERADIFLKQIAPQSEGMDDTRNLFRMAKNPYLLAALILVFDKTQNGTLPGNNGTLMLALVRALWERERQKQTPGWMPFEDMLMAFGRLAYTMVDEDLPIDVPIEYALKIIGNDKLLRAGHSANLIEVRGHQIRFYHQLIEEFFAATQVRVDALDRIIGEFGIEVEVDKYGYETSVPQSGKWDNVVVASFGVIANKNKFLNKLLVNSTLLATQCIASDPEAISEKRKSQIIYSLVDKLVHAGAWDTRLFAAFSLQNLGWKPKNIQEQACYYFAKGDWRECYTLGIRAVPYFESILDELANEERGFIVDFLTSILEEYYSPDLDVWKEGLTDWNSDIRELAATMLGETKEIEAVPYLQDALTDTNWFVQRAAADALWRIGTPEALAAEQNWRLKEQALHKRR